MSALKNRLSELSAAKQPSTIVSWFQNLTSEDQDAAWDALSKEALKTYTLFGIFREEGLRCAKDTFVAFRKGVLAGTISRSDIK